MNTQVREYTEFFQGSIDPVEMEEILRRRIGDSPVRPVGPVRSTHRRGWATAAVAATVTVIVLGSVVWFSRSNGDAPAVDVTPPTTAAVTPTTEAAITDGIVDPAGPLVPPQVGVIVDTLPVSGHFYGYGSRLVDGAIWIPAGLGDLDGAVLTRIDVATREVTGTVVVGRYPIFAFAANGAVWVTDGVDGTVSRIDRASLQVTDTIPVGAEIASAVVADGALWMAVDNRLVRFDLTSREVTDSYALPVPDAFWWMIATEDAIWGHDAIGHEGMHRFDLSSRTFTDDVAIGMGHMERPLAIVAAGGIWIAGTDGETVRLDLETHDVTRFNGDGSQPLFAHGAVWISQRENDSIVRIDPVTMEVTDVIEVGRYPQEPVAHARAIWVPNAGDGTVSRIDPLTGEVVGTITVGGHISALVATPETLWVLGDRITIIRTP
jgi:YVTN family beta-propeller protein